MSDEQMQLVDPAVCSATDDANPADRPDIEFLMDSLRLDGQRVPVILAPKPDRPGEYQYIDGHGRGYCLGRLKKKMLAIVRPRPVSDIERIEIKFSTNLIRRNMSLEEIAADASRYIELTGCSQKEAAVRLKCSDATISRALSLTRRIPAEYRAVANQLGPSVVSLISPLKSGDAMRQAFEFARTPDAAGKKPTRAELARFVGQLRGKKPPRTTKPKRLRLRVDDRRFEVELKAGDSPETLIEAFKAAVARLAEHKKLPLDIVAAVLADKEQPAA
jgi:ParB/RepB/Spo0J family partition protein